MREEYKIHSDKDGYYIINGEYFDNFNTYKSALNSLRKEKVREETAKEKAQKILNELNKYKEVRAEFDKLLRKEKLKQLEKN